MAKPNLAFRGHLSERPPVKRENSFSGQPGVYDMTSHVGVLTASGGRLLPKLLIQQLGHFLDKLSSQWGKKLYHLIK